MIVITFNSFDMLPELVSSIRDFLADDIGNHVLVVENSSDVRVVDFIESGVASDRVHINVAEDNAGFSHGVNLGYALAKERWGSFDFVVLLNPDVLAAGRVLADLVNRAARPSQAAVGIWSAVLTNERGELDGGCARRSWNRRRFFCHLTGYRSFAPALLTPPMSLTVNEIENDQGDLRMVSGALMCIRAVVFGDGLDVHLPMYLEDQEISLRCLTKGYGIRIWPDLQSTHIGGHSRRSNTHREQALQVMGMVESPIQCMSRFQGYRVGGMRLIVFLGGFSRFLIAPLAAGFRLVFRGASLSSEIGWTAEKLRLASWFMRWSLNGRIHTEQVSLEDYFREFETEGVRASPPRRQLK